eukprot:CAMPEP_0201721462 /NCGR_PEP_ID=MMETSP0593-20130828/6128_1 /ASSEMBLY_ACC=CAM_ASM_000672 /TAXON_ID=267983 /ORGANISM="Skeletonema japonicum, Strain CCMP2506" /LENGTH=315 /DNA_ID=CAMNT_0048212285 /DNA_START=76 /DNA_END=1023 /DNA_ORIENTATION=-
MISIVKTSSIAAAIFLSAVSVWNNSSSWLDPRNVVPKPFPFRYVTQTRNCVKAQTIIDTSQFINDLYLKHNIRFFPRNGFLLGIVRHGGFLPNEGVDVDMAVVYEDVLRLDGMQEGLTQSNNGETTITGTVGDFDITLYPTLKYWVNWKGIVPGTQDERYKFHGAKFSRRGHSITAYAVYPYHNTGGYFYPRANKAGLNHGPHTKDSFRYNEQGGDYRLVDTDVRMSPSNFKIGDTTQVGSFFDTNLNCFTEAQFYFTTIYIPCDYDKILTSQYGNNWRKVENRDRGSSKTETKVLSEEESNEILALGPRPVCAT